MYIKSMLFQTVLIIKHCHITLTNKLRLKYIQKNLLLPDHPSQHTSHSPLHIIRFYNCCCIDSPYLFIHENHMID